MGAGTATARDPAAGDFLEYSWSRYVGSGSGEYEGYTDTTRSDARLEVLSANATSVVVRSAYTWTYSSNEGDRDGGRVDRNVTFDVATRRWTSRLTDDDDHDTQNASLFSVWFWIPTEGLRVGDRVHVLDATFTVTSLRTAVWSGWLPRVAVELRATGGFGRNDEYGDYSVTYEDVYYYDRASGYVIAERYSERDEGLWQGLQAGFTWTESVDVDASSYAIEMDGVALAVALAEIGVVLGLVAYAVYRYRWRRRSIEIRFVGTVRVQRLKDADRVPPLAASDREGPEDPVAPTVHFAPFLADFARRALLAGDRVAIATRWRKLIGMAIYSRDVKVGQVFARDTTVAESLRRFVGARDFFSEYRHKMPVDVIADAALSGVEVRSGKVYNLLDTYHVLRLEGLPDATYDAAAVQRMRPEDLPAVTEIARAVYRVDSRRWLRAQYDAGDIGFVARVDGRVVGFAFASLVHGVGRLHTLTVLPEHRNRGLGRELVRARLHALRLLGARSAITEIAAWNLPSLHLAYAHGFVKVADMWVETTRTKRVTFGLRRR